MPHTTEATLNASQNWGGNIRKLGAREQDKLKDHLLRLDKESRRLRFAHGVSDAFLEDYVSKINDMNGLVYGFFIGEELHAAAELRKLGETWGREAEAAFSVEKPYQDLGIGRELMGRVIRAARNRGVHLLFVNCLAENGKMQALAKRHQAVLHYSHGDVYGEIIPKGPSAMSLLEEAVDDQQAYFRTMLNLQAEAIPSKVA